ncbi:MAG TPA: valine--tRNA ligase [Candidatus Polarisedimenticolia bacterium]|nr:valine--tRNA ligase [Candidatus Polarisedimenticolia bacterium]
MEIPKRYEPQEVERRWLDFWLRSGFFTPRSVAAGDAYCIVIPPPNITARLHAGHALNLTLQDILVRWRRMQGKETLWLPGTDHAGIATQMVVARELQKQGVDRHTLGREAFVQRVWEWKEEYGGAIVGQLKRLGASCDWTRLRFTLDEGLSQAVREVFVRLFEEGLIYRGKAIVNWCPDCRTALSDLEVVHRETDGKLYHLQYPVKGLPEFISVATTRPETMLGDTGVAVHPEDRRYTHLVGRTAVLPVLNREIPIFADSAVDSAFGTGAVKVTPAHDPNDFAMAQRHSLPAVKVIEEAGRMTAAAGPYAGKDRFACRRDLVEDLAASGVLTRVENHSHAVGRCARCETVVEPCLSDQWFVRMEPLARDAIRVVEDGTVQFVPDNRKNDYFEWMRNIHDWCISRQLWWGHRIPAWTCSDCGKVIVARRDPPACPACSGGRLAQDPDVLDTWFSSALWPFSTLGWPEQTEDLRRYYPTSVLVTSYDILFFWVARMVMMGIKFMGKVPFHRVYFNGLVRDEKGRKMSKTRGNTVDPLELMDRFGTDAVRFTLASMASPGTDIAVDLKRFEGYQAFANKIWNATRFVLMNLHDMEGSAPSSPVIEGEPSLIDRWILSRVNSVAREVERALEEFRYDEASAVLYHFLWHQFCDWYIEMVKPLVVGEKSASAEAARTRGVLVQVLDRILRLLHPFMPFLTEDLWQRLPHEGVSLAVAAFPVWNPSEEDSAAEEEMAYLMSIVTKLRNIRAENNIDPSRKVELLLRSDPSSRHRLHETHVALIQNLGQVSRVTLVETIPSGLIAARGVVDGAEMAVPLAAALNLEDERRRLAREIDKVERELDAIQLKLGSEAFLGRAPVQVVEKARTIQRQLLDRKAKLSATLSGLMPPGSLSSRG